MKTNSVVSEVIKQSNRMTVDQIFVPKSLRSQLKTKETPYGTRIDADYYKSKKCKSCGCSEGIHRADCTLMNKF